MHLPRAPRGTRPPVAAALALALALAACSKKSAEGADTTAAGGEVAAGAIVLGPQDVAVALPAQGTGGASITLSGPLEPKTRVTLRAQVPGTVQGLRVDRGSAVSRGQTLATISAEGVRSQAAGARAGVAAANAQLAVARQRLEAARTLRQAGAMSEIDYRTAVATYESAEAQVAAARAQASSAGEAAGFTTITAPISGVVSDRMVDQGEAVTPGKELITIVDSRTLELAGKIGVEDAARVRVGQSVTFSLDAYPGETLRGRVARIDPTADPGTRQVSVYVELANPTGRIIGGQFARGSIAVGGAAPTVASTAVTIPATAVLGAGGDGASASVFVIQGNKIVRRLVVLGARDDASGQIEVRSGLAAGERVIVTPSAELREGTTVTVAADAAGAPTQRVPAVPGGR